MARQAEAIQKDLSSAQQILGSMEARRNELEEELASLQDSREQVVNENTKAVNSIDNLLSQAHSVANVQDVPIAQLLSQKMKAAISNNCSSVSNDRFKSALQTVDKRIEEVKDELRQLQGKIDEAAEDIANMNSELEQAKKAEA